MLYSKRGNKRLRCNDVIFLDQPVKSHKVTYENIIKINFGRGDDYKTGSLLDYNYFKKSYKKL